MKHIKFCRVEADGEVIAVNIWADEAYLIADHCVRDLGYSESRVVNTAGTVVHNGCSVLPVSYHREVK